MAVVDLNLEGAESTASAIRALGRDAFALACDVGSEEQVERTVAAVLDRFGAIDVLINNAGITKRIALFDWTASDWEEVIRVNQVGTFLMGARWADTWSPVAREHREHVGVGGRRGGIGAGQRDLLRDEGAVAALTRDLAAEWAEHGVRVNAVAPGWFETEMNAPLLRNEAFLGRDPRARPAR